MKYKYNTGAIGKVSHMLKRTVIWFIDTNIARYHQWDILCDTTRGIRQLYILSALR